MTEVEEVVVDWMRELTGLPPALARRHPGHGVHRSLVAMLAARERSSGYSGAAGGLQAQDAPLVVYASPHAHSSIAKAVALAGFGAGNLRLVDVDPVTYAMRPDALAQGLDADSARRPASRRRWSSRSAPPAPPRSTRSPTSSPIARRFGAWVHVDAAMAGSALLLPEMRHLVDGIEGADSLGWNPHKWMGTILDCSLLYVRDPEHLVRVMSTNPSYLRSAVDGEVTQYKDWGIPLGRRFRALKLWFHLRLDGVEAIRAAAAPGPGERPLAGRAGRGGARLAGARARHPADGLPAARAGRRRSGTRGEALDAHTLGWAAAVNDSGRAFVTPSVLDGRWMVRVSVGAEPTERADVAALWR